MAKIGIDIRCLSDGRNTGVEEYTINILEQLFELDKQNEYILFLNSFRNYNFDLSVFSRFKNVKIKKFNYPNKLLNLCFWYLHWPYVDKMLGGVDIFFMPNIGFIALSKNTKLILTIHDLSYEIFQETFSIKRQLWHQIINPRKLCQLASKIIAVSESTKNDIISRWKISEKRVKVIYNGIPANFEQLDRNSPEIIEIKERYKLPFNFIFYLGTVEPRKNIPAIVKAYDRLREIKDSRLDKYKLVIAGSKGWKTKNIISIMQNSKFTDDIIFINNIINKDKTAVYTMASLFIYPSFFEGFGIPVLEAMRCGVPVITSNTSSLPEVSENGAIMVDPDKPDELYLAMKEVLLNRDFHATMHQKALKQAIRFNWKASARELLKFFE